MYFGGKPKARAHVWELMPPEGRVPNFPGAKEAALKLFDTAILTKARRIQVSDTEPQRFVRELALARGISVYVPSPGLRDGMIVYDSGGAPQRNVSFEELPELDAIVVGSVALTRDGYRAGIGDGDDDIAYAILRELKHPVIPVLTTCDPQQFVRFFPSYEHDVPIFAIATPEELIEVERPAPAPKEIDWTRIPRERVKQIPILQKIRPGR